MQREWFCESGKYPIPWKAKPLEGGHYHPLAKETFTEEGFGVGKAKLNRMLHSLQVFPLPHPSLHTDARGSLPSPWMGSVTCKQGWEMEISSAQTHGGKSFCKFPRDKRMFFLPPPDCTTPQLPYPNKSCDGPACRCWQWPCLSGLLWELLRLGLCVPTRLVSLKRYLRASKETALCWSRLKRHRPFCDITESWHLLSPSSYKYCFIWSYTQFE